MSNIAGGRQEKTIYQGYLDLAISVDLEKVVGLNQATINFKIINLHGQSSSKFVGDNLGVSNIDGARTTRLQQLYFQYQATNNRWGVKAGLLAADEVYLITPGSNLFFTWARRILVYPFPQCSGLAGGLNGFVSSL